MCAIFSFYQNVFSNILNERSDISLIINGKYFSIVQVKLTIKNNTNIIYHININKIFSFKTRKKSSKRIWRIWNSSLKDKGVNDIESLDILKNK